MKNKFLLTCMLLGALTVTGCKFKEDGIKATLDAPQSIDIIIDKGKSFIVFDEVEGAEYYNVFINGHSVTIRGNGTGKVQFDASKLIDVNKDYVIKVNAGGKNYFDSAFTDEYVYSPEKVINAPALSLDGTTLNWSKIPEATLYEVFVNTPTSQQSYKLISNSFSFEKMLTVCGEYSFYVTAINQNNQTATSLPSNQITYVYNEALITPHNLTIEYSNRYGEELLSFVTNENVQEFELNVNGQNYTIGTDESRYWRESEYTNVYLFRISAYAESKGIITNSESLLKVKVRANSLQPYLNNSQFSSQAIYQYMSVLKQPSISVNVNNNICNLQIDTEDSKYLSKFAIYLNGEEYKRIDANIRNLQISLSDEINDASIRVQAISNNNNCYNSNLSTAKYISGDAGEVIDLSYTSNTLSWDEVEDATGYIVEISNERFRIEQTLSGDQTLFDISSICAPGEYRVRIIALGQVAVEGFKDIKYSNDLSTPTNFVLDTDSALLNFDKVEGADGYVLEVKHYSSYLEQEVTKIIPYLFTSSPIDISPYLTEAQDYEFKVKAVNLINDSVGDSDFTAGEGFENIKILSAPRLRIVQDDEDYYLQITSPEDEIELVDKYEVWVNYVKFDGLVLEDGRIKVTEYLQNAGRHNFMVKAIAIESEFLQNSSMASMTHVIYRQLSQVENIKVNHIEDKYILSFDGPSMAGSYKIRIVKASDSSAVEFSTPASVADISAYIMDNDTYKIYVQAVKRDGDEYYHNSEVSGNPGIISKIATLQAVENISVIKDPQRNEMNLTWDSVSNCSGYRVQIYYNTNEGKVLKQTIFASQSNNPNVNIGSGKYQSLDKEGFYTIEIKALGDDTHEASATAISTYSYSMEMVGDFERNTTFINGNTYTYKVESVETLKNLLWRHYLYNGEMWRYNTFDYNLKIYCNLDLDDFAQELVNISSSVIGVSSKAEKMSIIATELLNQYTELLSYSVGFNDNQSPLICLNEQENIYIFSYQANIGNTQKTETSNIVYGEKVETVDRFNKRLANYKFSIDKQESIDVTTTEQLFMALQYNKQPNFVGDSEVAEAVYENARYVLRQICSENMSDYDKVLKIYEFLTKRVAWNYEAENKLVNVNDNADLQELYLESILYNYGKSNGLFSTIDENYSNIPSVSKLEEFIGVSSLSQGLAKAFVVLCSIEGIDSIKVNGKLDGKDYSWNKVCIDIDDMEGKQWYAIDLGSALKNKININYVNYQGSSHQYFMVTDSEIKATEINLHKRNGEESYKAETTFNYYSYQEYQADYNNVKYTGNMTIKDGYDIKNIIQYAMIFAKNKKFILDVDAREYLYGMDDEQLNNNIKHIEFEAMNELPSFRYSLSFTVIDNKYIIFAFTPVV